MFNVTKQIRDIISEGFATTTSTFILADLPVPGKSVNTEISFPSQWKSGHAERLRMLDEKSIDKIDRSFEKDDTVKLLEERLQQTQQELEFLAHKNRQNMMTIIVLIIWLIGQVFILFVPNRINWTWFDTHPTKWVLYMMASIIWLFVAWAVLDQKNRKDIIIGAIVMTIVTIVAPLVFQ